MENLDKDELHQLVTFYRQRCYDLELQSLQLQIKLNKAISQVKEPTPAIKTTVHKNNKIKE